ncbi:olfactory receptor 8S1-like [Heteronotia binoei]|uniref:olfactory receptor 8S1-like n=1 Tax=Heteronotia binoei TaxID=13085 RepID=UPI00293064CC|nr:olfactory receptor 8S1-like [Heteronotia binoei]
MDNHTTVTYFVLFGFSSSLPVQFFLILIFLFMYIATIVGNLAIIAVIRYNNHLQSPMYFFLKHLSFIDICFSSVTLPKLLENLCSSQMISYGGCLAQMFFIFITASSEIFILAAMAYDRYAAICKPLHYVQIMNKSCCRWLVGGAWAFGFTHAFINTLPVLKLVFCGPNIINHFSCEFPSLLALSCTKTTPNSILFLISGTTVASFTLSAIFFSYIHILSTVLKMRSVEAKKKTFSTCSAHLIVVVLYYGTGCFRYMRPNSVSSVIMDKLFSIQYSISTPMLNPIIYSLKTKEIKEDLKKLMGYK